MSLEKSRSSTLVQPLNISRKLMHCWVSQVITPSTRFKLETLRNMASMVLTAEVFQPASCETSFSVEQPSNMKERSRMVERSQPTTYSRSFRLEAPWNIPFSEVVLTIGRS